MNDSTGHTLHETLLREALHAHVEENGGDTGARLAGVVDGALRIARRRQRLARAGAGAAAAAVLAVGWVAVADGPALRAQVVGPAAGDGPGLGVPLSVLPVASSVEHACSPGSGGYTVRSPAPQPPICVRTDRAAGMTDVHVTSAKASKPASEQHWTVQVTLSSADRTRFAALTGSIARAPAPRNEFAIVVDGELWGLPYVSTSIPGGRIEISGASAAGLTSASAHALAHRLAPSR
ncbi:SecDF P1 head subdomain-containing protein [Streptomyces sp. NPDC090108]|uniref:SecDF P1 head subdomain-containing protein n=1 Tax=Streptomyces sp. NPDC090108 TaxID=3365947 RepID=UPI0037FE1D6F